MKKSQTILVASVLAIGIVFSGLAIADSSGKGYCRGFGFKQHHKGGGLMLLAKYQQKNLMAQVLSEMKGQSVEAIQAKFKNQPMYTVMKELNVDHQAFRAAMQVKIREQVKQAAAAGTITKEQEQEIIKKIENRSKKRDLMSRLVEKGVTDGIITQEEAHMLMRKPR